MRHEAQGAFSLAHRRIDQVTFDYMVVGGDHQKPDAPGASVLLPAATYSFFVRHQKEIYPSTPPHGYRSAVAYDAPTNTWITVGPNGTDISTDDGRNWRALKAKRKRYTRCRPALERPLPSLRRRPPRTNRQTQPQSTGSMTALELPAKSGFRQVRPMAQILAQDQSCRSRQRRAAGDSRDSAPWFRQIDDRAGTGSVPVLLRQHGTSGTRAAEVMRG